MGGIIFYHTKNQRDNFRPPSSEYNISNGSRRPGILSRAWDTTRDRRLLGFYGGKGGRAHPAKAWAATVFRKSATTASRTPGNSYMRFNIRLPRGPTSVYLISLRDCTVSEVIK